MDNILSEEEAFSLFSTDESPDETQATPEPENNEGDQQIKEETTDNNESAEVDAENLFDEIPEKPESVGSGKNTSNQEDASSEQEGTSPDKNFYSSIASALNEEGIFSDLEVSDDELDSINSPEAFKELIQKQIKAGVDAMTNRVHEALSDGVPISVIKQYENTLGYLNNINESIITSETPEGEDVRRRLIQQDFINRGEKPERAQKLTQRIFASGDDIEEARLALESNKEFYATKYREVLDDAKEETKKEELAQKKQADDLKKDILGSETVLGEIKLDKATRQKVYDTISRPIWKDPDTGQTYTAIQKYKKENENDFIKYMGFFFTLTNGFKDMDNIIKPTAKKEIKSKLRELEHTLNGTSRNSNGVLKYVGTGDERKQSSFFDKGFSIDIH